MSRSGRSANKRAPRTATVDIVDMSHDGRGVAKLDGKALFVSGALTGERATVEITQRRRSYDHATLVELHSRSPHRVEPRCAAFGVCGGCAVQHQDIGAQRQAKREVLRGVLSKIGKAEPQSWLDDLVAGEWGYRRKARLGVKHVIKKERVLVGFRERLKPYITDMARCEVLIPQVGERLEHLARMIETLSIRASLPQIEVAAGDDIVALVLRVLESPTEEDRQILVDFGREHDFDIWLQPGGLDTIAPLTTVRPLTYALPDFDIDIRFLPIDFVQVHAGLNRQMVRKVVDYLDPRPDDVVLDLFAGLGNFSLPLARRAGRVVAVEGEGSLVQRGRDNASANGLDNVEFATADLFADERDWGFTSVDYTRVLLDPPRSGAQQVLGTLAASAASRIVYVSCHPGTLARDTAELVHQHGFTLSAAGIMDMFPHTAHVESVAVFDR